MGWSVSGCINSLLVGMPREGGTHIGARPFVPQIVWLTDSGVRVLQVDVSLTCCDFQKAQMSELLKVLLPRSRFAELGGFGQVCLRVARAVRGSTAEG